MKGLQNRLGFNLVFKSNLKTFTNLNTRFSIRFQSNSFKPKTPKLVSKPYNNSYSFYKVSAITCTSFLLLIAYEYSHDIIGNESILERFTVNQPTLFPKADSETYIRGIYEQSLIEEEQVEKLERVKSVNYYAEKLQQKNLSTVQRFCYRIMYSYSKVVRVGSYAFTYYLKEPFLSPKEPYK